MILTGWGRIGCWTRPAHLGQYSKISGWCWEERRRQAPRNLLARQNADPSPANPIDTWMSLTASCPPMPGSLLIEARDRLLDKAAGEHTGRRGAKPGNAPSKISAPLPAGLWAVVSAAWSDH